MEKNNSNGYAYSPRTVEDMLTGQVLGTEANEKLHALNQAYDEGDIGYDEWSEEFSKLRHVHTCTVGGSSIAAVVGRSPYKTPSLLQKEITAPNTFKEKVSWEKKLANFAKGHCFESGTAKYGAIILEHNLNEMYPGENIKVRIVPFEEQCYNSAFPYCVGDFDCLVVITGGPFEGYWLGEVKTLNPRGEDWMEYLLKGEIPPHYQDQMDFYLGILPFLRGGIMLAAGNKMTPESQIQIMFERDNERSLELLNAGQEFCEKAMIGIPADDSIVNNAKAFERSYHVIAGALDEEEPPVDLTGGKYVDELAETTEKLLQLQKEYNQKEKALLTALKVQEAETLREIKKLEERRDILIGKATHLLKNSQSGEAVLSDGRTFRMEVIPEVSWTKGVKSMLKNKYPEAYEAARKMSPHWKRKVYFLDDNNAEDDWNE